MPEEAPTIIIPYEGPCMDPHVGEKLCPTMELS